MYAWELHMDKPAVYKLANVLETRGPSCLGHDAEVAKRVLNWGWADMRELEEATDCSAADLLSEFWDQGQWSDGSLYFPGLLVFGNFAGSKDLTLNAWRKSSQSSDEDIKYSASCVKYVPTGWALFVIEEAKKKHEKTCRLQEILKWAR